MALPIMNVTPQYDMIIPSTQQKVKYRPYLVKEEKILLMAFESKDTNQITNAMANTIEACLSDNIDVANLTTFDVEYMFIKIRSKSVGEISTVNFACEHCKKPNEIKIDLDNLAVEGDLGNKIIKLTDDISIEMKYPSYKSVMKDEYLEGDVGPEKFFSILTKCINAILTEEERFDANDSSEQELMAFVDSLTSEQLMKLTQMLEKTPGIKHKIEYDCGDCGEHNEIVLEGIADFF